MICPYTLTVAAIVFCYPTLNEAMQEGLRAHKAGKVCITVEGARRGRTYELRIPPPGLRELLYPGSVP